MQIKAQILSFNHKSGQGKDNKPYSFHIMSFIDVDSTTPTIMQTNLDDITFEQFKSAQGKIAILNLSYYESKGFPKFKFESIKA